VIIQIRLAFRAGHFLRLHRFVAFQADLEELLVWHGLHPPLKDVVSGCVPGLEHWRLAQSLTFVNPAIIFYNKVINKHKQEAIVNGKTKIKINR